ncbi:MAG: hypothetical protein AXA67_08625 [Methylothermaceae bacteria B42]|nr:MAG: hypothetical protein AXA67_08625 [Methylothermaceae bacteria B42]HHJ39904.1 hypothetical protein [Methylothermaceae bacterium]
MKSKILISILLGYLISGYSFGYGGGGGGKQACKKPQFTQFQPGDKAEVAPASDFSFVVTQANSDSIQVTVKKHPVTVEITPKNQSLLVAGKLPEDLKDTYARVAVTAQGPGRCKGTAGWLLKITQ